MGLFDYVNFEMSCPSCGKHIQGFQTKSTNCSLDTVEVDDTSSFYSSCSCGIWVDFSRSKPVPPRKEPPTLAEVESMGFKMTIEPDISR